MKGFPIFILFIALFVLSISSVSATPYTCGVMTNDYQCDGLQTQIGFPVNSVAECKTLCEASAPGSCCSYNSGPKVCYSGTTTKSSGAGGTWYAATCSNKTAPYINIYNAFDINQTDASLGTTFFYGDYTNVSVFFVFNGTNQSVINYTYSGSSSEYYHIHKTGLTHNTLYTYNVCYTYNSEILGVTTTCEAGKNFTTDDYTPPSINVISAYDITNHEATLGSTVLYNDYPSVNIGWYLEGSLVATQDFTQVDEFDTSIVYPFNLTGLDYNTSYDYELRVRYLSMNYSLRNVTTCVAMTQTDTCTGTFDITTTYGYTWNDNLNFSENGEVCNSYCENDVDDINTCCQLSNGYCYGYNGTRQNVGGGSDFASNCTTSEVVTGSIEIVNSSSNFTTDNAYIPYITIFLATNIQGNSADLSGTYYYEDYNSTIPYFRLNNDDLLPKINYSGAEPYTWNYVLSNLSSNTTYNYSFCVGYGLGWALSVCSSNKNFTTPLKPAVTFYSPTPILPTSATLHWKIAWLGTTNVTYKFRNNGGSWLPTYNGLTEDWLYSGLNPETNYTYYLQIRYEVNGTVYYYNTTTQMFRTYYENAFDDVWDTMFQGSSIAKILLGFVVLLGTIFLGVSAFGKYNIQISVAAILIFTVIGTVLATLMKLFSVGMLLLLIVGAIILIIVKNTLFSEAK